MKYLLAHKEDSVGLLSIALNGRAFAHAILPEYLGIPPLKPQFCQFQRRHEEWFCEIENWVVISDAVERHINKTKDYSEKIMTKSREIGEKLYKHNYEVIDNEGGDLSKQWEIIFELFYQLCAIGLGAVMSDLEHHRFSNRLEKIISEKITQYSLPRTLGEYVSTLTYSTASTRSNESRQALQKLARSDSPDIESYLHAYGWLEFGHLGPALTREDVQRKIKAIPKRKRRPYSLATQKLYASELHLSPEERHLFQTARNFNSVKTYRTELMFLTFYALNKTLTKLSSTYNTPIEILRCLLPDEFIAACRNESIPKQEILKARYDFSVYIVETFHDTYILTEEKANEFVERHKPQEESLERFSEIRGNIASPGVVRGTVRILNHPSEMHKVNEGDILVASQTIPQLLPAMHRASAFVTDIGGITSHAAIVAREMKKPCIIGTKIATRVLKDGYVVEVDANQGIIRRL